MRGLKVHGLTLDSERVKTIQCLLGRETLIYTNCPSR
jgi:hypothetical protein